METKPNVTTPMSPAYYSESGLVDRSLLLDDNEEEELLQKIASMQEKKEIAVAELKDAKSQKTVQHTIKTIRHCNRQTAKLRLQLSMMEASA